MAYLEQAFNAEVVTPNDNADLTLGGGAIIEGRNNGACLYIGTGGNLTVTMIGGQVVTFANVVDGTFMPIQVRKVWASGTDAADILSLY
jgi:hypothetical protein